MPQQTGLGGCAQLHGAERAVMQATAQNAAAVAADQLQRTKAQAAQDLAQQRDEMRRDADIERGVADAAWAVTKVRPWNTAGRSGCADRSQRSRVMW